MSVPLPDEIQLLFHSPYAENDTPSSPDVLALLILQAAEPSVNSAGLPDLIGRPSRALMEGLDQLSQAPNPLFNLWPGVMRKAEANTIPEPAVDGSN